jgi:hypothetical protein
LLHDILTPVAAERTYLYSTVGFSLDTEDMTLSVIAVVGDKRWLLDSKKKYPIARKEIESIMSNSAIGGTWDPWGFSWLSVQRADPAAYQDLLDRVSPLST